MYNIITTDWKTHSKELSHIRSEVFLKEQRVPVEDEWDEKDEAAVHFLVQSHSGAIGCARLLIDEPNNQPHFHIGRVAILQPFRAQGIGHQLMKFILDYCTQTAPHPIYLHAQTERQNFYKRLGFVPKGDVFMDAGIPHISMYLL